MIPEARLQEIEHRNEHWDYDTEWVDRVRHDLAELVAEVRRLREQRDEFFIETRRLREALARYENEAPDWLKPIARAALTEESDQKEERCR